MHSPNGELRSGEIGGSRIGCLLGILFLVAVGYAGVIVIGSEFDYRAVQGEMQRQASFAVERDDEEIRTAIVEAVRDRGLPSVAEQVSVRRLPGNRITISLQYTDTLTFLNRWRWIRPRRLQLQQSF